MLDFNEEVIMFDVVMAHNDCLHQFMHSLSEEFIAGGELAHTLNPWIPIIRYREEPEFSELPSPCDPIFHRLGE
jgi:hypothetical protein